MSVLGKRKLVKTGFESAGIARSVKMQSPQVREQISANRQAAILRKALNNRPLQRNGNMKQESGYVDLPTQTAGLTTAGSISLIATVAQGAAVTQRIGKKIRWESIQFRGLLNAASATTFCKGSLIVVYDKRPTGVLPAVTDVLVTADSNSMNNDNNSGRFQILRRIDWAFAGLGGTPTTGLEVHLLDEFIRVRRPGIFKAAATGGIGDIEEGALYAIWVGSATGTASATVNYGVRVRFMDV